MGFSLDPSQWGNDLTQAGEALGQVTLAVVTAGGSVVYETIAGKPPAQWISALGNEAIAVCNVFGFVGTNIELTFFVEALEGKFSSADLWNALKKDYDNFTKAKDAATDIVDDGDYTKAWNLATDNGADAIALADQLNLSLPTPAPAPSFDGQALYTQAIGGGTDMRLAAQLLFDHGYYTQGNDVLSKWREGLVNSPLGAVVAADSAIATGDPLTMLSLAGHLTAAETDPVVTGEWTANKWGLAALEFGPIIDRLQSAAADATKARLAREAATVLTVPLPFGPGIKIQRPAQPPPEDLTTPVSPAELADAEAQASAYVDALDATPAAPAATTSILGMPPAIFWTGGALVALVALRRFL